jgi:hypothetical protein
MWKILSQAFRIRIPALFFYREVRAHPSLRTNGNRPNSLKTIGVATRHPSLNPPPESAAKIAVNVAQIRKTSTNLQMVFYWNTNGMSTWKSRLAAYSVPERCPGAYARRLLVAGRRKLSICKVAN